MTAKDKLKKDFMRIEKLETGLLKIHVWDKNADTDALICSYS
jgi:hypothetical protein